MNLWEIGDALAEIEECLKKGENPKEWEDQQKDLELLLTKKTDGCCAYMDKENDLAKIAKEKIAELTAFKKARENNVERMKGYIRLCMETMKVKEINGDFRCVKMSDPQQVIDIYDEDEIPKEYKQEVTETKIDGEGIKKKLKQGEIIEGARLKDSPNRSIKLGFQTQSKKKKGDKIK